jgi:hypothetical protein
MKFALTLGNGINTFRHMGKYIYLQSAGKL